MGLNVVQATPGDWRCGKVVLRTPHPFAFIRTGA
jgi:hypothetical protein